MSGLTKEVVMHIKDKIHDVTDEVCKNCGQNYEGECRAYKQPNTAEEKGRRMLSKPLCEYTK